MKKKLTIFMIVAALVICMIPVVSAEGNPALTVTPSTETVAPGGTVTVSVAIRSNPGHLSGEVKLTAPESLTLTAITQVMEDYDWGDDPEEKLPEKLPNGMSAIEYSLETAEVCWTSATEITGDFTIFTATYIVAETVEIGTELTITVDPVSFRNDWNEDSDPSVLEPITVASGSATVKVSDNVTVTTHAGSTAINYSVSGQVVTVTHTVPCKVGYWDADQSKYVAVTATANEDGSYSFTVPGGVTDVILVVKGDATGDGNVNNSDVTRLKAITLGKYTANTAINDFAAEVTGEGTLNNSDVTRLKAITLGKFTATW